MATQKQTAHRAPETNGRSESVDAPTITREQLAEYQRMAQAQEQQALQAWVEHLQVITDEAGYAIVAIPQFTSDGRVTATWGVRRKSQ